VYVCVFNKILFCILYRTEEMPVIVQKGKNCPVTLNTLNTLKLYFMILVLIE